MIFFCFGYLLAIPSGGTRSDCQIPHCFGIALVPDRGMGMFARKIPPAQPRIAARTTGGLHHASSPYEIVHVEAFVHSIGGALGVVITSVPPHLHIEFAMATPVISNGINNDGIN
jgi:hypothetical protein